VTLHLVRLPVDLRALATFAVANGVSDDDGGYALHLALRRRFGEAAPQPFRLFADDGVTPHLLGYATEIAALNEMAGLPATDPDLDGVFTAPPQMRAMPENWREGARYGFTVRARPVVRFGKRSMAARAALPAAAVKDNWWARAGEVDAWVAAMNKGDGDPNLTRETAYRDWLATRLGGAATLEPDSVRLIQSRRVRTRRSSHGRSGRNRVEGPEALLSGTLTVTDPAAFAQLLARGVGRHAAFGYGLLLLTPPGRSMPDHG
jgi:CRISPR system Cascade subunit CasE